MIDSIETLFYYGVMAFIGAFALYGAARLITAAFFRSKKDYEDK